MKFEEFIAGRKKVKLGFIGGSITEGGGSSTPEKRYSSQVVSDLASKYPDTEFFEINAGVGGTTSACGLFRLKRDLLDYSPDVVFVEFAVNDVNLENSGVYVENIIRTVKKYKKDVPVILLYTCTKEMFESYGENKFEASVTTQMELCEHYSLNQINLGYKLYEKGTDIDEVLGDGVHPNDKGHRMYADVILAELDEMEICQDCEEKNFLYGRDLGSADMVLCSSIENGDWEVSDCDMMGKLPDYTWSEKSGNEFFLKFSGGFLGLYYIVAKDSGILEYSVDGGAWKEFSCWDQYALSFDRPHFAILEASLEEKSHCVRIRNSGRKDEKSTGTRICIGALAVQI